MKLCGYFLEYLKSISTALQHVDIYIYMFVSNQPLMNLFNRKNINYKLSHLNFDADIFAIFSQLKITLI